MFKQLSYHMRLASSHIKTTMTNNVGWHRSTLFRFMSNSSDSRESKSRDESSLKEDLNFTGIHLDEIDQIMSDQALKPVYEYYPKLEIDPLRMSKQFEGHNVVVIQPWVTYANFSGLTDPELQLQECVSLANTINNWNVVGNKILFANKLNTRQLVGPKSFEDLKEHILGHQGVSAVFFGLECLSGVQLSTLERELRLPVYDRFTVVLNIFRQHARTKEAKIQLALAELPYIRSHLREIHESSEYSSSAESLKTLVGGVGERFYHQRLNILKRRERTLRHYLDEIRKQRDMTKKQRKKSDCPVVSVVGYTNSGKTSLIKYLTQDESLVPKDQLFATLDVTVHAGQLPSSKTVLYLDTVGFVSRIPTLLVESFSATLKEVQESDLIVHILDITHPDHRLQYSTVMKALTSLKIPRDLLDTKLTVGNKLDLLAEGNVTPEVYFSETSSLPDCDLNISIKKALNMDKLVKLMDRGLMKNLKHEIRLIRVENGGKKYAWLRKYATMLDCQADAADANRLICRVSMSPPAQGKWAKIYGTDDFISEDNNHDEDCTEDPSDKSSRTAMSAVSLHNLVNNFNDVTQQSIDLRTSDTNWTYEDNIGQMFGQCNGSRQSPINIDTSKVTENLHLRLGLTAYDKPISGFLVNQFPTFQLAPFSYQWPRPNALVSSSVARAFNPMGDSHFVLNYVQFYWSQSDQEKVSGGGGGGGKLSIHKINGENYLAELHFVHLNTAYSSIEEALTRPDGLLIFAVMVVPSTHESYIFDKLLDELQSQNLTQPNQRLAIEEDSTWRSLLPADTSRFYRYQGSMIAPPCHEAVQWIVFEEKLKLGQKQLKRLRRFRFLSHDIKRRKNNFMGVSGSGDKVVWTSQRRQMQPLNGRLIERSFGRQSLIVAATSPRTTTTTPVAGTNASY